MAGEVIFAHHLQSGSPTLTGTAGSAGALLKAVLVDGFGSIDVASIVVSSGVATVTTGVNNNLLDEKISGYLPVLVITGTGDTSVDGRRRVKTIFSTSIFEFECPGAADGSYTNGLSFKRAPLGWTTVYDVAGKTVFRNNATTGSGLYLECLDDNSGTYATAQKARLGAFTQFTSDPYTLTNQVGETARNWIYKSGSANTTQRPWVIVGDDRTFYFLNNPGQVNYTGSWFPLAFGDIATMGVSKNPFVIGYTYSNNDPYYIAGNVQSLPRVNATTATQEYVWTGYNHDNTENNVECYKRGVFGKSYVSDSSSTPVNPDTTYLIGEVLLRMKAQDRYLGKVPGFYCWPHAGNLLGTYAMFPAVINNTTKTILAMALPTYNITPMYQFDLYGPWSY